MLIGYLFLHFIAVLAYAFPGKEEHKLKFYVFPYIYPYFHQNWSMFVPVPTQNFNVYVKIKGEDWKDIIYDINSKHQANRFGGYEATLLSLSSALRFYSSAIKEEKSEIVLNDRSNINFEVVKKIMKGYLISQNKKWPEGMDIIIQIKYINSEVNFAHYYKGVIE